jgi:hypothetical protein
MLAMTIKIRKKMMKFLNKGFLGDIFFIKRSIE